MLIYPSFLLRKTPARFPHRDQFPFCFQKPRTRAIRALPMR